MYNVHNLYILFLSFFLSGIMTLFEISKHKNLEEKEEKKDREINKFPCNLSSVMCHMSPVTCLISPTLDSHSQRSSLWYNPSQECLFNRINPLARGVAPAKVMSLQRHHFSWGTTLTGTAPLVGVNWTVIAYDRSSGTGKFTYFSASVPWRHHFSWGLPFKWGNSCIGSQLKCLKGSGTGKFSYSSAWAILATLAGGTSISL